MINLQTDQMLELACKYAVFMLVTVLVNCKGVSWETLISPYDMWQLMVIVSVWPPDETPRQ